jgi:hypothetical protein
MIKSSSYFGDGLPSFIPYFLEFLLIFLSLNKERYPSDLSLSSEELTDPEDFFYAFPIK